MSLPIRNLPVIQNWDCHLCGQCCKEYVVAISEEEKKRIEEQGWDKDPEFARTPLFIRRGLPWKRTWRLNHRADGSCVFLSENGHCRIHERFGYQTKPLPCRLFPFILIPAGDHWRVGVRYACPSSAGNLGRNVKEHEPDIQEFARELARRENLHIKDGRFDLAPPFLQAGQVGQWDDLLRIVGVLQRLITDRRDPVERRLRKCLAFTALVRQAKFDKVSGSRLDEFLNILALSLDSEVPGDSSTVPAPSGIGRVLFRMILAIFARKDQGPLRGVSARGRVALLRAAVAFVRGKGQVPRMHAWLPEMTFAEVEAAPSPHTQETEELLERYYSVKIGSLQFFSAPYFGYSLWGGLHALALTFPMIHFLARMFHTMKPADAVAKAVSIIDDHFGFNKLLSGVRYRMSYHILASRGETERLIAWYGR